MVPQLLNLVSELDTLDSKKRVLGGLIAVINESQTRVCSYEFRSCAELMVIKKKIVPFMDGIAQQIPTLCGSSGDPIWLNVHMSSIRV